MAEEAHDIALDIIHQYLVDNNIDCQVAAWVITKTPMFRKYKRAIVFQNRLLIHMGSEYETFVGYWGQSYDIREPNSLEEILKAAKNLIELMHNERYTMPVLWVEEV